MKVYNGIIIKEIASDLYVTDEAIRGLVTSGEIHELTDKSVDNSHVIADRNQCILIKSGIYYAPHSSLLCVGSEEEIIAV